MDMQYSLEGEVIVLTISGKIMGGEEASACHRRIHEFLDANKKKFVFDMGRVDWTNSQGLGMLIGCYVSVTNAGARMLLVNIENIRQLLETTRLLQFFECYENVEEAKRELAE